MHDRCGKNRIFKRIVTGEKVEPSPDKIKAILDIAPPTTLSQANKFIGKVGYYRKFIQDFAKIAAPIHKITNKTRTQRHQFKYTVRNIFRFVASRISLNVGETCCFSDSFHQTFSFMCSKLWTYVQLLYLLL